MINSAKRISISSYHVLSMINKKSWEASKYIFESLKMDQLEKEKADLSLICLSIPEFWILTTVQGLLERSWVAGVLPFEIIASYIMSQFFVMVMQVSMFVHVFIMPQPYFARQILTEFIRALTLRPSHECIKQVNSLYLIEIVHICFRFTPSRHENSISILLCTDET